MLILLMMMAANNRKQRLTDNNNKKRRGENQQTRDSNISCKLDACYKNNNSNSSEETVIARIAETTTKLDQPTLPIIKAADDKTSKQQQVNKIEGDSASEQQTTSSSSSSSNNKNSKLKSLLLLGNHLNPFSSSSGGCGQQNGEKCRTEQQKSSKSSNYLNLLSLAQRYFGSSSKHSGNADLGKHHSQSQSAPVTPIKWRPLDGASPNAVNPKAPNGMTPTSKPSVRFREEEDEKSEILRVGQKSCYRQGDSSAQDEENHQTASDDSVSGECPMDSRRFREHGYKLIDYISNYLDSIRDRRVTPLNIEPGYLKSRITPSAPEVGEPFAGIMRDFERDIMCGITHWQHPHFHAYFPAGNAYPSILADMLSDALGCVGFSWAASPAYTELEIIMLDWMGKLIGLPDEFLCMAREDSKGGGVIQGSASECVLVNLLAARHWAIDRLRKKYPNEADGVLLSRLIGYCSKEAHSCVEKAAMIGFIRMRALDTDEHHSLRGETLERAIELDQANGLEPFLVCATLGTTSCCSFDNLLELGKICQARDIWLHVDAAYAGSALICPEFKHLLRGIECANSFNMNPNKWMLINFDCSLMWVKDRFRLTRAFVVDPLYLQHSFSDQAIDYRHWGIPLSRRFRALKLWFVIRNYGAEGLRAYIRNHVRLAKLFASLIESDPRFVITNQVELGLVCFRLVGSNALNQRLLSMINASGKLHMVPASLNGRYVIRFCVCDQRAQEQDIRFAYDCIAEFASELFELIRSGKERIRAISQQNTIDVSSISLHRQQSASADCHFSVSSSTGDPSTSAAAENSQAVAQLLANGQQVAVSPASPTVRSSLGAPKSPLLKQASVAASSFHDTTQTNNRLHAEGSDQLEENLAEEEEEELALDSLATLDPFDELDDDELDFLVADQRSQDQSSSAAGTNTTSLHRRDSMIMDSRSPVARRASRNWSSNQQQELDEAEDEVFTLAERRNRMSLRYKREFFVRVVSDPRVYRASISGDINAHAASCCSLGNSNNYSNQQPKVCSIHGKQGNQQHPNRSETGVNTESNESCDAFGQTNKSSSQATAEAEKVVAQ